MTSAELRKKLSLIEPTEEMYSGISAQDVPALKQLLEDKEEWIAARAIFSLSRLGTPAAVQVLAEAATDRRSQVRVSIAAAVSQRPIVLPDSALMKLLQDSESSVRKFATHAVKTDNGADAHAALKRIAADDAVPTVRDHAAESLRKLR